MSRARRIGLVFSYSLAYCRGILRGIKAFARTRDNWIFTPVNPEADAGLRVLRELEPAGVIAHVYNDALARALRSLDRPVVNVCGVLPGLTFPRVGLDDAAIGRLAAEHLIDRGLRNFAFVGHADHGYSVGREGAYRRAVRAAGFPVVSHLETRSRFEPRGRLWSFDDAVLRWLVALPKPVGVFACNDVWGAQLSEVCRQAHLRVPEDVALLGVDNDDLLCELARPSLSSVAVPSEAVGHAAGALLDRLLSGKRPPALPTLLPPRQIVTRQSSDILAIDDPDVAAVVRAIRQRAHEQIRIDDVLDAAPVSRRSLERRFRSALGRGIGDEIRRVRMDRVRQLLADSHLPVAQVATSAGFTDGKHLSVVFRQEMGMTPTAYRRRIRGGSAQPAVAPH